MVNLEVTQFLVLIAFIVLLAVLVTEKIDKTALALIGATVISIILYLFPQPIPSDLETDITAPFLLKHLPWDTVFFIFVMMLIVTSSARSGLFQWFAIKAVQVTKGHTYTLYFSLIILTFSVSFFFDTVTTMLIMAPLTIEVMNVLDQDFRPYLIMEAIVANFGSIPSLVGSVPNIIIGNATELSFLQFLIVLGPLALILLVTSIPILLFFQKSSLGNTENLEDLDHRIFVLDAGLVIKNSRLFIISIGGLVILILGFSIGQFLNISPVLTAMIAMSFLLLATREQVTETLKEVQWGTIFFIVGLLFIVQAMEELLIIEGVANLLKPAIDEGSPEFGSIILLWISGLLSGAVDNIPISAAFASIATELGDTGIILPLALAFGVNIGGYLSPIASPANILAISFSEKEHKPISMVDFAKVGTSLAIIHLIIGSLYFILFSSLFTGL